MRPRPRLPAILLTVAVALASTGAAAQPRPGPLAVPAPAAALVADPDPWVSLDKALHFSASAALAGGGYGLGALASDHAPTCLALGAALALSAGAAKEAFDAAGHGTPSWRDLAWNVVGATFGLALALSVDAAARPESFGPRR